LKSSDKKDFDSFEELEQYFKENLPIGIENIKKKFLIIMDSELTSDKLYEIRLDVHKLAGSAGTFGYDEMNRILKNLDNYLYEAMNKKIPSNEIDTDLIKKSIDTLCELLSRVDGKTYNHLLTDFPVLHGKILEKIPLDWDKSIFLFFQKEKPYIRDHRWQGDHTRWLLCTPLGS